MPKEEASLIGAEMEFGSKYPDIVSVYMVEDEEGNFISKEFVVATCKTPRNRFI